MIYLVICSMVWGVSYGLIKGNLTGLSPDLVAWARMVIPLICFIPFLKIKKVSLKECLVFFAIGAIQYGVMYLCILRSYQYLAAYQIVLFSACTPLYVTLINDAFSKKFSSYYLMVAGISLIGSALLYYQSFSWGEIIRGFLLVQVADICFAFGQVTYKRFKSKRPGYTDESIYALLFFGGTVITSLSTTVFGAWGQLSLITVKQGWILLCLGTIATGFCFFLWNKAALSVCTGTLAVLNNLKTPLGVAIAIFFLEKSLAFQFCLFHFSLLEELFFFQSSIQEKIGLF